MTVLEFKKKLEDAVINKEPGRNRMGCGECCYDPLYLLAEAIHEKDIDINDLSETEIDNMIAIAEFAAEVFY